MNRVQIMENLISKNNYKSYLEIGVQRGRTFNSINTEIKVGIDPETEAGTHKMTSDEFFAQNKDKFDLIFIDGLHHSEQVIKDLDNSLLCLNKGGTIIVHDCLPTTKEMQIVPRVQKVWTGDVWKAWVKYRQTKGNLKQYVINTDMGCGIIQRGRQTKLLITEEINYEGFVNNKENWMNIISADDFVKM